MLWILHSTVCMAELRCTMYNAIFNPMNLYRFYCIGTVCLRNESNICAAWYYAAMMVLDCLPLALPCSYRNTSKQWPLSHTIKPIEKSTNVAFMTKKTRIQAWLKNRYMGSAWLQTKHVHAGRPGVPAPVMIKRNRNPIFHHLWRSEQYSAFAISQSKSDFHYQHIIRVPARLFALKSCSCCCCPLPFKLRLFRDPFLQSVLLWKLQSSLENGRCVSQDIMLPNYHFSRVLFCQNIMLPKHCDAKFQNSRFFSWRFFFNCS